MTHPDMIAGQAIEVILPYSALSASGDEVDSRMFVRALSGEDELMLDEALADNCMSVDIASMLIGCCAGNDNGPVGTDAANAMTVGDREVVLRAIYSVTFSPVVEAQITCGAGCDETIEYSLDLREVTERPPEPGPVHQVRLAKKIISCSVPSGRDLRRALSEPRGSNGENVADHIARLCSGGEFKADDKLADALTRLDPNAECKVSLSCPECGAQTNVWLDGFELIRGMLNEYGGVMLQINKLAETYGWTESEILALPRKRRLRYCELITTMAAA